MELLRSFLRCYFPDGPFVPSQTVGCFLRLADWGNVSNIVQCETKRVSLSTLLYLKTFHWKVPFRRSKKPYTDDYERTKKCEVFFSFKLRLYRWFCFPKNRIQNKRNYRVLSPTGNLDITKGQGTSKIWSLQRGFVIYRFFFIYFATTEDVKTIVRYTEDFIWRFVISRFHCKKRSRNEWYH